MIHRSTGIAFAPAARPRGAAFRLLVSLSFAACASGGGQRRTGAARVPRAGPAHGAPIVAGGGDTGPESVRRLVLPAGGPDAGIVIDPGAGPDGSFPPDSGEPAVAPGADTLRVPGLAQPVEIRKDRWGISHIYARSEPDLFFAQGWSAARDRLFQFELWRRQATGTLAEVLGPRALERDIGARLHEFRGDLHRELAWYHPRGQKIVDAYVRGVNAYIDEANAHPETLPLEFRMLGIRPRHWTPAVVISRHQGLLGNIGEELRIGREVAALGPEKTREINWFQNGHPKLALDSAIDGSLLSADILRLYEAFRRPVDFRPEDVAPAYRAAARAGGLERLNTDARALATAPAPIGAPQATGRIPPAGAHAAPGASRVLPDGGLEDPGAAPSEPALVAAGEAIGSNNWVVAGRLTATGRPFMANDPHRVQQAPSLRYWVHLVAPGWDVIGGGEPVLPGVSIGHNRYGAWGLTVFDLDGEDLYVYETNPADPEQYRYRGAWERMKVIRDTIPVKGRAPVVVALMYTRHGPVLYEDTSHHRAYALRAAWRDIGAAPYLASLRMDQAKSWEEFRAACSYSRIPGENMVWAGVDGTIGWQPVGVAPVRPNWSGLVPVPGDGRYEWAGYLPILQLPHVSNPDKGFWATANQNDVPAGYAHMDAVGHSWADPFRVDRIDEVLGAGRRFTLEDMERLQQDVVSVPARRLVPLLAGVRPADPRVAAAARRLLAWDDRMDTTSVAATIYALWERRLAAHVRDALVPPAARALVPYVSMTRVIEHLRNPGPELGAAPAAARDTLLVNALSEAVAAVTRRYGGDLDAWRYGRYHHALLHHPMTHAVDSATRARLDVGPLPRPGYGYTVNATSNGENQTSGASFRIIADVADWDRSVGTNAPGQSGDPASPHYSDLFRMWATGGYFPVAYSRSAVEAVTEAVTVLEPGRMK